MGYIGWGLRHDCCEKKGCVDLLLIDGQKAKLSLSLQGAGEERVVRYPDLEQRIKQKRKRATELYGEKRKRERERKKKLEA
jgi:hypothetical protein